MRFASSATIVAVITLTVALHATPTAAQDDRGRMHFQAGASYFEAGEYDNALREFLRAYELSQRAALFYNISSCYQQLGDLGHAAEYLDRYLREVEEIPNRGNLELRLQHLRERAAARSGSTGAGETGAGDTEATDATGATGATGDGAETTTTTEDVTTTAEAEEEDESAEDAGGGPTGLQVGGYVGLAAGGAGAVLAATFGVMALKERDSVASSACGMARTCTSSDVRRMDKLALVSDLGLGLAVVGIATGIVLLVVGGSDEEDAGDATASARVSPWVAPGGAGAVVTGRF